MRIVGVWRLHRAGVDVARFLDAAAPGILVAQAIGRIGNYFNQELIGRPTSLPWGLEIDPEHASTIAAWRERPGKVCLRAHTAGQWGQVLAEPHALAGERDDESVAAIRARSARGPLLERLQAMSTALEPPSARVEPGEGLVYALNPAAVVSSGKTVAQVAHAAGGRRGRSPWWRWADSRVAAVRPPAGGVCCLRVA